MFKFVSLLSAVLLAVSAQAAVLEDFEGGDYVGPGTLVTDPTNASNTVLELGMVDNGAGYFVADVYSLDISALGADGGTVSFDVYDFGKYFDGGLEGARWGVEGDLNAAAIGILEKSWLGCEAGYAFNTSEYDNQTTGGIRTGSWFSAYYAGGPRRITTLDTDGTSAVAGNEGAWATWSFTVDADGYISEIKVGDSVLIDESDSISGAVDGGKHVGSLTEVWASASKNNAIGIDGLLIDNIAFGGGTVVYHPGDANGDDAVNIQDFVILKQNYNTASGATWAQGDFNGDGAVNIQDFVILKQNYNWAAAN